MNRVKAERPPVYFRHADGDIYYTTHFRKMERVANGESRSLVDTTKFKDPHTGEWLDVIRYIPVEIFVSTKENSTEKHVRHCHDKVFFRTEENFNERFTALTPEEVEAELH